MNFQLKHLDLLSKKDVDFKALMIEASGMTRWRFWNVFKFIRLYKQLYNRSNEFRNLDIKNIQEVEGCKITRPLEIDSICFASMIELHSILDSDEEINSQYIATVISICCYGENHSDNYDSSSTSFKNFIEFILQQDLLEMIGLYKWIVDAASESMSRWDELFAQVSYIDEEYERAGGQNMSKFNILISLQNICKDFNVGYKQAWQIPYGLTQASSLAKATSSLIQRTMSKNIEEKMRIQRGEKRGEKR